MEKYSNHPLAGATDLDSAMNIFWVFFRKHFLVLYIISVISSVLSTLVTSQIDMTKLTSTTDVSALIEFYKSLAVPYTLLLLVSLVFSVIMQVYIIEKPVSGQFSFFDALKKSLISFFPYLAAIILMIIPGAIMIGVGFVLFILPGIFAILYFLTISMFLLPVIVMEKMDPVFAVKRSLSLANRNFWPNLGWVAVMALLVIIFSVIVSALVMLPFTGTFIKSLSDPSAAMEMAKNPLYLILASLTGALVGPVFPILAIILYFRNSEEDVPVAAVVEDVPRVTVEDLYPKMPEENETK